MIDFEVLAASARHEGIEHFGVGVVVRDRSGRVLLIRRAAHDDLPGLWEYPGGGREDGEAVDAGAARELAEETGLTGLQLEYARTLDYINQSGRRVRQFVFTTVVEDGTAVVLSDDHDGQQWARPDALPQTGDGQRQVITWLAERLAAPGWRPVGGHLTTIARPATYGSFLVTDPAGRILGLRSATDPDIWDFPGGMVEKGESPFEAAVREAREELGLDLPAENPRALRRRLVAVIHTQADADYPVPVVGHVFDGGTLTAEQQARIRLDPAEHTEFRFETAHDWRHHMGLGHYQRLRQVLRAHRCARPLYLERPAPLGDDFEGVLVLVTDPAGRLLMHLRDTGPGPWPGYWTPPGGWREGDESAEEAAVREVREEAGIEITGLRTLPAPHPDHGLPLTRVLHTVWNGSEKDLQLGDEGQALRLVPMDEVLGLHVPPYLQHYLPLLTGSRPEGVRS
ncbi:NUDIX hydrolase [Streptacidiphilus jiangxiensis]|uniref:ADP-ribose pyrophosphatase YjhB, NUDIX family n=1 Tax=Streptacidiphilus jiangxiensis TaxID=235985 RepID=A0A1H8BS10_STRJI|nr:NUDIX hydrolase [Streptacidiphilus jiangxiensis]SEM85359.1 ADP-ribose pyrophosphatase YjhB, NUDIX family [Streptacidiphilus jiangxiensis]